MKLSFFITLNFLFFTMQTRDQIQIPKNIFQTHKSQEYIDSNDELKYGQKKWKECSGYNYYFYNDAEQDEFMKTHFADLYEVYNNLPLKVMKADLWRYCIIYKYGGIYSDADTVLFSEADDFIQDAYLVCAPEKSPEFFCQWTFSAPAGSPIIKSIIDVCIDRLINHPEKYRESEHFVHFYTGPDAFTEGIERYLESQNIPLCKDKKQYTKEAYPLFIFDFTIFHEEIICHFFTGGNGWNKDRDAYWKMITQN